MSEKRNAENSNILGLVLGGGGFGLGLVLRLNVGVV